VNWTKEIKNKFTIFILNDNVDQAAAIKTALNQEGFAAFMFTEKASLLLHAKENTPHLIVFNKSGVDSHLQKFVQSVVDLNSEIQFLPLCAVVDMKEFLPYREYNFIGVCPDGDGYLSRLAWMVDQALRSTYLLYQNEQVIEAMEQKNKHVEKIQSETDLVRIMSEKSSGIELSEEFKKYRNATSKEDVLQIFLKEINQTFLAKNNKLSSLYFKFLPSVQSFVATQSIGVDIDSVKGVGGKFTEQDSKDPLELIKNGHVPSMIQELMKEGFSTEDFIFKPVFFDQMLDGFFIFWSNTQKVYSEEFENYFTLFLLFYERGHLLKKMRELEISDPVTEFHTRAYYDRVLHDEVVRARRLQKAVSVVKMSIDHLPELEQLVGKIGKDQILRLMSSIIRKTSRVNDITCRLAENEFALLMPHAARKGATLRAERLRRMIETQIFQNIGQKVTVSLGVSEYPSFCSSAEDLDKSVTQALSYIADKGGNKVCLFTPTENFMPDFNVPPL